MFTFVSSYYNIKWPITNFFCCLGKITRGQETTSPTWITVDVLKSEHNGAIFIALSQTVNDA